MAAGLSLAPAVPLPAPASTCLSSSYFSVAVVSLSDDAGSSSWPMRLPVYEVVSRPWSRGASPPGDASGGAFPVVPAGVCAGGGTNVVSPSSWWPSPSSGGLLRGRFSADLLLQPHADGDDHSMLALKGDADKARRPEAISHTSVLVAVVSSTRNNGHKRWCRTSSPAAALGETKSSVHRDQIGEQMSFLWPSHGRL
ncbi:uncharacterized protein LOC124678733 isoform X2 [Lolium rigidum]|uniref:uncharacterized protein LOC124678733 isoform X2 n=1 Tax=Lolium rigidum TaxID=89674 RepID=UPI001F5DAC79|nr:uncharacterized protein LOC124678733 isoform X2 [Lolium rigidum]